MCRESEDVQLAQLVDVLLMYDDCYDKNGRLIRGIVSSHMPTGYNIDLALELIRRNIMDSMIY